jgi:tripartite-type tricarboxylate transporter receptor subunit TctC
VKDFAPVLAVALGSMALVVHPSVKASTVSELVALAKAQPGRIHYGSPGNGTPHHLAMELFKNAMSIDLVHVPYKGSGPAVTDLVSGQIGVMFLPVHLALPQVTSGRLRMLASGGLARANVTPDTPSLAEAANIRDVDVDIWYGLYAPAGTPRDVVTKLNAEFNALLKLQDVRDTLAKQGLVTTGGSEEDLGRLTAREVERWARVVREAKIEAD